MLLERARQAGHQVLTDNQGPDRAFLAGRREAYYEVLATLLGQLDAFGLPRGDYGVPEGFDPERDLL